MGAYLWDERARDQTHPELAMSERKEVHYKMGWINPFTIGGSLWGWFHTHTWQGAAWGFAGGVALPIVLLLTIIGLFIVIDGTANLMTRQVPPRYRVEVPGQPVEDPWAQAYAEHCEANNLPNELRA